MKDYILVFFAIISNVTVISQDNRINKWKLSIQSWTFHKYSLLETIEKVESLGIKYIEVYPGQKVGEGYNGPFSYNLSEEERARLKIFLQKKRVKIIALGVVDKEYYNLNNLEQFFIFCKDMGISYLTAEPEPADMDLFNQLAKKYQIKVALHCHPKPSSHYWHPDSTIAAMKGRPEIGAWPDMGHWARNGIKPVEGLKKMQGKLWGLHFKDVKQFDNVNAVDTLHGKGVCNLVAVIRELKRQRFRGIISLEYEANENNNMGDMRQNIKFYEEQVRNVTNK